MSFDKSDILFRLLQIAAWAGFAVCLIAAAVSDRHMAGWLFAAGGMFGAAIASTLGSVQIQTLQELEQIRKFLREQADKPR